MPFRPKIASSHRHSAKIVLTDRGFETAEATSSANNCGAEETTVGRDRSRIKERNMSEPNITRIADPDSVCLAPPFGLWWCDE